MEVMRQRLEALETENRLLRQASGSADGQQDHGDAEQIVYKSDTLEMIKKLPPAHFDLLYTNPPFGTTGAAWDKALDWDATWPEIWRVLKPNGAVVLHCSMPFTYDLAASQRKWLKYHYTWVKNNSTTFMLAKTQPMRIQEEILVFYKSQPTYNPQMLGGEFHNKRAVKHGGREGYWGNSPDKNQESAEGGHTGRYPETVLYFDIQKAKTGERGAGTRRPEMVDFFLNTYTNAGDKVLDITCFNAITGERCAVLGRQYVGIDIEPVVTNGIPVVDGETAEVIQESVAEAWPKFKVEVGKFYSFSPDAKKVPKDVQGKEIKVVRMSKKGDKAYYLPKGAKKGTPEKSTDPNRLVPRDYTPDARGNANQTSEETAVARRMTERYFLSDNDIFVTPDTVFDYLKIVTGYSKSDLFDPCPAEEVEWDALEIDWKSPAFCNPPFSQIFEKKMPDGTLLPGFMEKAVQQAEQGVEVIMLIDAVAWQASLQGVDRREMIRKWKTRVSFEAFSLTDDSGGINHKWFVWEKNVLTGKKGGGPRFGNVFLRLTNRMAPGLHIVPVTDEVNQFLVQRKKKSITMSTVGDAKDDARNSRLEELDDKIERLTPTVSPVAGGADAVDELSLGMANASFDDAREELNFPEFLKCHMCLKTTTDVDGVYFEETMWICYPCVYRIADGEIFSPR